MPRPPIRDLNEEDPGDSLVRQLREYKRFKEISNILSNRQDNDLRSYSRIAPSPNIETGFDIEGITLQDLIDVALASFSRVEESQSLGTIVTAPRITIREKINLISDFLFKHNRGSFRQLFSSKPLRIDIVVTFLAILELVKLRLIFVKQGNLFEDIQFEKSASWDTNTEIDLEFGE